MLTLYHFPAAICAQKNRICLAEKAVKWASVDAKSLLRTPDYLKLNPGGYAPTLVHDDQVVTESRIISEYIDEVFGGSSLQPSIPFARAMMRRWTKQIDDSLHSTIFMLSFIAFGRDVMLAMPVQEQARIMPLDIIKRERMLNILLLGWNSPHIPVALHRFEKLMEDMQATLSRTDWLAGDEYTLADADLTPYLQRLSDLGLSWLWEHRPAIGAWFDRVQKRPSFSAVKKDWFSEEDLEKSTAHAQRLGPQFRELIPHGSTWDIHAPPALCGITPAT